MTFLFECYDFFNFKHFCFLGKRQKIDNSNKRHWGDDDSPLRNDSEYCSIIGSDSGWLMGFFMAGQAGVSPIFLVSASCGVGSGGGGDDVCILWKHKLPSDFVQYSLTILFIFGLVFESHKLKFSE